MKPWTKLGQQVRDAESQRLEKQPIILDEGAFVRRFETLHQPKRGKLKLVLAATFGLIALTTGLLLMTHYLDASQTRSKGVASGDRPPWPADNTWIEAPMDSPKVVSFAPKTRFTFLPKAKGRVLHVAEHGAHLLLEHGQLAAIVNPAQTADWRVDAGPFQVRVTGTRFKVSWFPQSGEFKVAVTRGSVLVHGPLLPHGQYVEAGRQLLIKPAIHEMALTTLDSNPVAPTTPPQTMSELSRSSRAPSTDKQTAHRPARSPHQEPARWLSQLNHQEIPQLLTTIEANGLVDSFENQPPTSIMRVADVARRSGKATMATRIYHYIRLHFPNSETAKDAAYDMARVLFDQRGDSAQSLKWLNIYLNEAPHGKFRREALGRKMEAEKKLKLTSVSDTAKKYLAAYPDGPHRALATKIVSKAR